MLHCMSSIILEAFQSQVEGVEVNLDYAVNPTGRFYSEVLGEDRTYRVPASVKPKRERWNATPPSTCCTA